MGVDCQRHAPAALDPVSIVQEVAWVTGPVWTDAENLPPTGIHSRTVQPVVNRYTDLVIPTTLIHFCICCCIQFKYTPYWRNYIDCVRAIHLMASSHLMCDALLCICLSVSNVQSSTAFTICCSQRGWARGRIVPFVLGGWWSCSVCCISNLCTTPTNGPRPDTSCLSTSNGPQLSGNCIYCTLFVIKYTIVCKGMRRITTFRSTTDRI